MTQVFIGIGRNGTECKSMKDGLKICYDYIKDHPRTTAYMLVIDSKDRYYFVHTMYVNRKKTPVAYRNQLKIRLLKSDGSLGKTLVKDGVVKTRQNTYVNFKLTS